jgi:hypothetical protein
MWRTVSSPIPRKFFEFMFGYHHKAEMKDLQRISSEKAIQVCFPTDNYSDLYDLFILAFGGCL